MSISTNFRSSLRQSDLHTSVERQTLALGAARDRASQAALLSREHGRGDEAAIDGWENEGGTPSGTAPPLKRDGPRKLSALQLSTDLFRDDTLLRALILNGILLLVAGAALLVLLNS
jgi:hypothetical protein